MLKKNPDSTDPAIIQCQGTIGQPAYSVRTPSASQQNAIQMVFCWQADSGQLLDVICDFLFRLYLFLIVETSLPVYRPQGYKT